jgi:hypothetical protein
MTAEEPTRRQGAARATPPAPARLVAVWAGGTIERGLPEGAPLVVGRSTLCDVRVDDASVSRRHVEVLLQADKLRVADLGSSNGTRVRGRTLAPGEIDAIGHAEALEVGDALLLLHLPGTPAPQPVAYPTDTEGGATAASGELREAVEQAERARILDALAKGGGNQTRAAKILGVSRRTLVYRLDRYGLPRPRKGGG